MSTYGENDLTLILSKLLSYKRCCKTLRDCSVTESNLIRRVGVVPKHFPQTQAPYLSVTFLLS